MNAICLLTFVGVVLGGCGATPERTFARETGKFSLQLYKTVVGSDDENMVLSPLSVQTALGLAYMGADGATAEQMAQVMHLSLDKNSVGDSFKEILDDHSESRAVKIANKIFLDKKFSPRPQFMSLASEKFASTAETVDTSKATEAADTINSWVESSTNNLIRNLVSPKAVENTTAILVNAVYFKADWVSEFKKRSTRNKDFYLSTGETKTVEMMQQTTRFEFGDFEKFKVVNLPYRDTDLSLLVLLPHERDGLPSLEREIEDMDVKALTDNLQRHTVQLELPKFKTEYEAKLKPKLIEMGMSVMFSNAANFNKMTGQPIKISDVIHKAVIAIDEKGTEAAAATAVLEVMKVSGHIRKPVIPKLFIAEHPFLYMLVDSKGHIFFMGRYVM